MFCSNLHIVADALEVVPGDEVAIRFRNGSFTLIAKRSTRLPLAATVRAIQHCAVETDERGGCDGLPDLSVSRTSGFCRFSAVSWRIHTKQWNQALTVDAEGVSRKWGDEDAGDMTGWAIAGREIADGVGFAVGRNGD